MTSARFNDAFEQEQPPPSRRAIVVKRGLSWSSKLTVILLGMVILTSLFQISRARSTRRRAQLSAAAERQAQLAYAREEKMALHREQAETPITVDPGQGEGASEPESRENDPVSICPNDMVLVDGDYCPSVAHICARFLSAARDRCAEYRQISRCFGEPVHKRVCIDRYEYPNLPSVLPVLGVTWNEARTICKLAEKRLCTDSEWALACEGPGRLPYPYGYVRDKDACNIDKPYINPDPFAFANPDRRAAEIARVDQREPSGSRAGCVSPFGVRDMTGNVDEWVFNESGFQNKEPYVSGLKGGYWGPVRNRCRPMTTDHNPWHEGYQIGFRCCSSPQDAPPESRPSIPPNVFVDEVELTAEQAPDYPELGE